MVEDCMHPMWWWWWWGHSMVVVVEGVSHGGGGGGGSAVVVQLTQLAVDRKAVMLLQKDTHAFPSHTK